MSEISTKDLLEAVLNKKRAIEHVIVPIEEFEIDFQYRKMGFLAKSRCVAAATEYIADQNPQTQATIVRIVFKPDVYFKSCLKEMLVDPPIPLSDAFLEALSDEAGSVLQTIIPDAWTTADSVGPTKKEQESSITDSGSPSPKTKTSSGRRSK